MKIGSKRAIFGVIWGVFRGLDLVWESATPPTYIWERSPKKKTVFFLAAPLRGKDRSLLVVGTYTDSVPAILG